jgi:hypothetical protein
MQTMVVHALIIRTTGPHTVLLPYCVHTVTLRIYFAHYKWELLRDKYVRVYISLKLINVTSCNEMKYPIK